MSKILEQIVESVTNHLVGNPTTVASPTRNTNDAISLSSRTTSPIASHHGSVTVDLATQTRKRAAPTDTPPAPDQLRHIKRTRISPDEARLVKGNYKIPADAVPAPDPRLYSFPRSAPMPKPGSNHSLKPVDTISGVNRGFNYVPKKYGSKGPSSFTQLQFLDHEPARTPTIHRTSEPTYGRDPYSAKRRKVGHATSSFGGEASHHSDDEVVEVAPPSIRPRSSPPQQLPMSSPSRHSVGSGHTVSESLNDLSRSEFSSTCALSNSHRKSSRKAKHSSTPSRTTYPTPQDGVMASSPIMVDKELELPNPKTARQLQLQSFQQGISTSKEEEVVSKHFGTRIPAMNHSTLPPRGEPESGHRGSNRATTDLRHQFKRHKPTETIADSEDELYASEPQAKYRAATSFNHPSRAARNSKSVHQKRPAQGWPLRFARTHEYEEHGPRLNLTTTKTGNAYRIVGTKSGEPDVRVTKHEILFSRVNTANTDDSTRIRLLGGRTHGRQYLVDLEFQEAQDLSAFRDLVDKSISADRVKYKEKGYMETIFFKQLPVVDKASSLVGDEIVALQPSQPNQSKTVDGQSPAANTGIVDQLLATSLPNYNSRASRKLSTDVTSTSTNSRNMQTSNRPTRATRASKPSYLDEQEELFEAEPPVKYSEVYGLGIPWERQLNYGSGRRRAVVDFEDLLRLDDGEFLNDQLIDFYLLYLSNQAQIAPNKVYIFNTHFFPTLTRKIPGQKTSINYAAVARWTSKEDLFGYDYIVVPINQDVHWYLAIICNVSNIARKPAIGDSKNDSTFKTDGLTGASSERPVVLDGQTEDKTRELRAPPPPPTLADSATAGPAVDENLFDEESSLNLVDAHASRPVSKENITAETVLDLEAPTNETTAMARLSISDSTPKGILPSSGSSPASSRKTKRKSGPPAKKWDTDEPTIIILDSLGGGARSQAVRALKNYILEEGREKRAMEATITPNAFYAKDGQIPMQNNFSDCGVYLLGYAQKFFEDPDGFKSRLLKGEMQTETDWPDMPMPEMRNAMREILQGLQKQQETDRKQARKDKKQAKALKPAEPPVRAEAAKPVTDLVDETTSADPTLEGTTKAPKPTWSETIEVTKPTLAPPFEPQPTNKRDARSLSPPDNVPTKVDGSPIPSPIGNRRVNVYDFQADDSAMSPPTRKRKASPKVVIPAKSPRHSASPKQTREQSAPKNNVDELDMIEVHSPKRHKSSAQTQTRVPLTKSTPSLQLEKAVSPRLSKASLPQSSVKPRGHSQPPAPQLSSFNNVVADSRGSSSDPIPIDDSQDAATVSQSKTLQPKSPRTPSPDPIVVMSPRTSRVRRSSSHQPRESSNVERTERALSASTQQAKALKDDEDFVGNSLDEQLRNAQESGPDKSRPTSPSSTTRERGQEVANLEDEVTDFEGFADDDQLSTKHDEVSTPGDDAVVQETPPETRSSPGFL